MGSSPVNGRNPATELLMMDKLRLDSGVFLTATTDGRYQPLSTKASRISYANTIPSVSDSRHLTSARADGNVLSVSRSLTSTCRSRRRCRNEPFTLFCKSSASACAFDAFCCSFASAICPSCRLFLAETRSVPFLSAKCCASVARSFAAVALSEAVLAPSLAIRALSLASRACNSRAAIVRVNSSFVRTSAISPNARPKISASAPRFSIRFRSSLRSSPFRMYSKSVSTSKRALGQNS